MSEIPDQSPATPPENTAHYSGAQRDERDPQNIGELVPGMLNALEGEEVRNALEAAMAHHRELLERAQRGEAVSEAELAEAMEAVSKLSQAVRGLEPPLE
jgi:hypothetical protein